MSSLKTWFFNRTGLGNLISGLVGGGIPSGGTCRYYLGALLVFNFFILLVTGLMLGTAYSPSSQTAWESVFYIDYVMEFGWLVRGLHHFGSQSMVVLLALFVVTLIYEGGYRPPREFSYWTTLGLMLLVLGLAHTGYLLPWDQRGYQAAEVFTNIAGSAPVIGPSAKQVIQGGSTKGHAMLTRLTGLHTMILPLKIVLLFGLHYYLYRRANWLRRSDEQPQSVAKPFWPNSFLCYALSMCVLFGMLVGLTYYFGRAPLTAPADPSDPFSAARPEWYFLFLFRLLKTPLVEEYGLAFGAIHLPGAIMAVLFLMPIIGRLRIGHWFNVLFITAIMVGIIGLTGVALYEDSRDADFKAALEVAQSNADRAIELALSNDGIPLAGAIRLLQNDPLTQGPKLYASRCASCHFYDGHDGLGHTPEGEAKAADLGEFGSRVWIEKVLLDYETVFAPTENLEWDGELLGDRFTAGEMASWSRDHAELLSQPENKPALESLVEFLYAQSEREPFEELDQQKIKQGRQLYEDGYSDDLDTELNNACIECHTIKPLGEDEVLETYGYGPTLTGYASRAWLESFIKNPAAPEHYGYEEDMNAMPAFETQLTEQELELLVRWMVGDYYRSESDVALEPVVDGESVEEDEAAETSEE